MKKLQFLIIILLLVACNVWPIISFSQIITDSLLKNSAINIYNNQNLQFGTFSQGTQGGTLVISPDGMRSVTGSIVLLNFGSSYSPSIFEIEAPKNSIVSILSGPDVILTGSNGGTMSLKIGASKPGSPFPVITDSPGRTQINIGGTLTVGNSTASPPGVYTGNFYISIVLE